MRSPFRNLQGVYPVNLLPCPLCGGSVEWEYIDWDEETQTGDDGMGYIECKSCRIKVQGDRDQAATRWNRRYTNNTRQANDDQNTD